MTAERRSTPDTSPPDRVDPAPDDGAAEIAGTGAAPVVPDPQVNGAEADPDGAAADD